MVCLRVLLIGLTLLVLLAPAFAQTNLYPHPDLPSASGWVLQSGATWSSGALHLLRGSVAHGPLIPISPGQTYTCGASIMGTHAPTDFMRLSVALYTSSGTFLRTTPAASNWTYAHPGVWQDVALVHVARADETRLGLLLSRAVALDGTVPVAVDQIYCYAGIHFREPASPKRGFAGTLVNVDTHGHFTIRQPQTNTWQSENLRCMYTIPQDDWTAYAPHGFNCHIWALSAAHLAKGVIAGMPYAFFQLAQYITPGSWGYKNLALLRADLGGILASPYAEHLIGYYYDNESPEQYLLAQQVLSVVRAMDMKNGQRQRPIYILQGNPGQHIAYTGMADVTGSYDLSNPVQSHLRVLQGIQNMVSPVSFLQIQQARRTSAQMQATLQQGVHLGVTNMGYWHNATRPVAHELWYEDFPEMVQAVYGCTPSTSCVGP